MFKLALLLPALAAAALACLTPAAAGTLTHDGNEVVTLATGFGPLRLTADRMHGTVTARFGTAGEGWIVGDLAGGMARGVWFQDGGMHRCPVARLGQVNWGTISFAWPADGHFMARWGFCDGDQALTWDGVTQATR